MTILKTIRLIMRTGCVLLTAASLSTYISAQEFFFETNKESLRKNTKRGNLSRLKDTQGIDLLGGNPTEAPKEEENIVVTEKPDSPGYNYIKKWLRYVNSEHRLYHPEQHGYLPAVGAKAVRFNEIEPGFDRLMLIPVNEIEEPPAPTFTDYSPEPDKPEKEEENINTEKSFTTSDTPAIASQAKPQQQNTQQDKGLNIDQLGLSNNYKGNIPAINPEVLLNFFEDGRNRGTSIMSVPFTVPNDKRPQELAPPQSKASYSTKKQGGTNNPEH